MSYRDIDFGDMQHGVDVMEEFAREGAAEQVKRCLMIIQSDIGNVNGTAATHLHGILARGIYFNETVNIQALRNAINALAVDCATASNIESSKQTKTRADTLKSNTAERHSDWQKLANELSKNPMAIKRNWKKIDYARHIKKEMKCQQSAKYIATKIKKPF